MAEFPALPLFTDAYLADTRHLTTEEHGAYLLLLICAWRSRGCALKDDDKTLARIAGLSPTRWRRLKPALVDFFQIEDGLWRQKKLTAVHTNVAVRVARNKANGAKGGRASRRAALRTTGDSEASLRRTSKAKANPQLTTEQEASQHSPKEAATKTKSKTQAAAAGPASEDTVKDENEDDGFDVDQWRAVAARSCGAGVRLDNRVLYGWYTAGVDMHADMAPTITAILTREIARTGKAPRMLAYFRESVLDAQQDRIQRETAAQALSASAAAKLVFDPESTEHWQQLLGDAGSRFRGDYMARHWFIGPDHPVFLPAELGANPRLSQTRHIPPAVYQTYASNWGWLPVKEPLGQQPNQQVAPAAPTDESHTHK